MPTDGLLSSDDGDEIFVADDGENGGASHCKRKSRDRTSASSNVGHSLAWSLLMLAVCRQRGSCRLAVRRHSMLGVYQRTVQHSRSTGGRVRATKKGRGRLTVGG